MTINEVSGKIDRRIRKTKQQLRLGLTKLLKEKSVNEISVRELSELADLNRGTFYLHYKDIFDMVEKIENEMFDQFYQTINKHDIDDDSDGRLYLLTDIFKFIADNADMCMVLLGENGDLSFVNKLKKVVEDRYLSHWKKKFDTEHIGNFNYFYSYIVSGCTGLFQAWLENDMKESPDEMAKLTESMIINGINFLDISKK